MKLFSIAAIILPLIQMVSGQECPRVYVRKEMRSLSDNERQKWINVIQRLINERPDGYNNALDYFAWAHIQVYPNVHSNPQFLPWHRHFLYILQERIFRIDPDVVIPYWDWARDSQQPQNSVVLTDRFVGGNGNEANGWALENGPFANAEFSYPQKHILKRCYHRTEGNQLVSASTIDTLPDTTRMESIVNSYKVFSQFAWNLELYHGYIHMLLGGLQADLGPPQSPNDPVFFLHHANIDRYWWKWQNQNPDLSKTYDGEHFDPPKSGNLKDQMKFPGGPDITVEAVFDTTAYPYCYTYESDSRVMLAGASGEAVDATIVKGTNMTVSDVSFDKIGKMMKVKDGALKASSKVNNSEVKPSGNPKIKEVNPAVVLAMMRNMNMEVNETKIVDKIKADNAKISFLSGLEGFNTQIN